MNYFNPKEDVIDLKLTQFGKHLLSKGKLSPKFYAFFDDDVIYDIKWAEASLGENQSDIQSRIQDETPRARTQTCYYGIETELLKNNELVRLNKADIGDNRLQPHSARHQMMSQPLGNSSLGTNKMPGWEAYFLLNSISGSTDYITGSSPNIKIPQLNCEVKFKAAPYHEGKAPEMELNNPDGADDDFVGAWGGILEFDDHSMLIVEKDSILLEIDESNTDYLEYNFDIEVYEVKTVSGSGGQPGEGTGDSEELLPLYFSRLQTDLGINYFGPSPIGSSQNIATTIPEIDPSYVEYFFDINVDREIDNSVVCKNLPNNKTRRGRLAGEFRCPDDGSDADKKTLSDMADGLYESEIPNFDDLEDCD